MCQYVSVGIRSLPNPPDHRPSTRLLSLKFPHSLSVSVCPYTKSLLLKTFSPIPSCFPPAPVRDMEDVDSILKGPTDKYRRAARAGGQDEAPVAGPDGPQAQGLQAVQGHQAAALLPLPHLLRAGARPFICLGNSSRRIKTEAGCDVKAGLCSAASSMCSLLRSHTASSFANYIRCLLLSFNILNCNIVQYYCILLSHYSRRCSTFFNFPENRFSGSPSRTGRAITSDHERGG